MTMETKELSSPAASHKPGFLLKTYHCKKSNTNLHVFSNKVTTREASAGWRSVFSSDSSLLVRILWMATVLISCALLFWNVVQRFDLFFNGHPAIKMETIINESVRFPSATICPYFLRKNPIILKQFSMNNATEVPMIDVYDYIESNHIDLQDLWNETDRYFEINKFVVVNDQSMTEEDEISTSEVNREEMFSVTGKCHAFSIDKPVHLKTSFTRLLFVVHQKIISRNWIQVMVHQPEERYKARYFIANEGLNCPPNQILRVHYDIHEKIHLNISEAPCFDSVTVERCTEQCLNEYVYKSLSSINNCRLPFMIQPQDGRLCTKEHFRTLYSSLPEILKKFDEKQCLCPRKCRETRYNVQYQFYVEGFAGFTIILILPNNRVTVETEYWPYTIDALLSDIGGSMGLFLGISILSLAEFIEKHLFHNLKYFLCYLNKRFRNKPVIVASPNA